MTTLEQARLNLKKADPDLYAYITAVEVFKVLDSAKEDAATGAGESSRLWAMASNYERRMQVLSQKNWG